MEYFTTFWTDFDIAEIYGEEAIIDTASRAYEEWKSSIKYIKIFNFVNQFICQNF